MKKKTLSHEELSSIKSVYEKHQLRDAMARFKRMPYAGIDKKYSEYMKKRKS